MRKNSDLPSPQSHSSGPVPFFPHNTTGQDPAEALAHSSTDSPRKVNRLTSPSILPIWKIDVILATAPPTKRMVEP